MIKILTEKNTEILDIEEKYRSDASEDPTEKYAKATKPGVPISAEMRLKVGFQVYSYKFLKVCDGEYESYYMIISNLYGI